jgi:sugar/nucleoside kinase (ribokinase family)
MKKYDIIVAGHICLDITPSFPNDLGSDPSKVFVPGRLLNVGKPTLSTGGAVSNTGMALLRMGLKAQLMAKIGNDEFGSIIKGICEREGTADGLRIVEGEMSSYTCVIAPPGIDRIFFHCPGCNDTFTADDVNYEMVAQAKMFHFGYPSLMEKFYSDSGVQLSEMFRKAKETGVTTTLDQSYPDITSPAGKADWLEIYRKSLKYVDIFLPSVEETLLMLNKELFLKRKEEAGNKDLTECITFEDIQNLGNKLIELGVGIAVIKCGARGIYLKTAHRDRLEKLGNCKPKNLDNWTNREIFEVPYNVPVVSATGSGDSAIAAFLASMIKNCSAEDAISLAGTAGARAVQTPDSLSSMISFDELIKYRNSLSEKLSCDIESNNKWTKSDNGNYWHGPNDNKDSQ